MSTNFFIILAFGVLGVIGTDTVQLEEKIFDHNQGSGSGIYYEPIYKMKFYSSKFNLITHVNISVFIEKFDEMNNLINYNDKLCLANTNVSNICNNFKSELKITKTTLLKRYTSLMSLQNGVRMKRGLINVIGEFENWAFGVVGDSDYQKIQQEINTNKNNNEKTLVTMKTQVKLVQSSLNQMSNVSSITSQNFIKLQREYNDLVNKINFKQNDLIEIQINQQLSNYLTNFNFIMTSFSLEMEELLNALLLAHKNILHPVILNNIQLKTILGNIQSELSTNQVLPLNIDVNSSLEEFMKLVTITTKFSNFQLLFIINFPICTPEIYTLFQIWPMPIEVTNSQFMFIQPNNPYLAISQNNQQFISFSDVDYNKCTLGITVKYCELDIPVYLGIYPLCEIQLLKLTNNTVLPKQCAVHHIFHNNAYFKKLNTKNTFLYWVSTTVQTTLVCSASTTFHILKGAGTIKLPSACSLYTPTTILRASEDKIKNINMSVNISPDISLLNISELNLKINKIKNSKIHLKNLHFQIPELKNLHQSSQKLDDIIRDIDKESEDTEYSNYQNWHIYGLYLVGGIVGYLVVHKISSKIRLYCRGEKKPENIVRARGRVIHLDNMV
jgi:hypothetical protein